LSTVNQIKNLLVVNYKNKHKNNKLFQKNFFMEAVQDLDSLTVDQIIQDLDISVAWSINNGLLNSNPRCPRCGNEMRLYNDASRIDHYIWRCSYYHECGRQRSTHSGSIFENSKEPLPDLIKLVQNFCRDNSLQQTSSNTGISTHTVSHYFKAIKDLISEFMEHEKTYIKL